MEKEEVKKPEYCKTGIVLGGGGTLGDFQVGALKYLYKIGVLPDIDCVCGTSIGAINAAMVAMRLPSADKLEEYWCKDVLTGDDLIPQHEWSERVAPLFNTVIAGGSGLHAIRTFIRKRWSREDLRRVIGDLASMFTTVTAKHSLYKSDKLRQRLREVEGLETALNSGITFRLYATNLKTGKYTCFSNGDCPKVGYENYLKDGYNPKVDHEDYLKDGYKKSQRHKESKVCDSREKLIEGALASAALPGVFPPVTVDGDYYIDGFVRENVPILGALHCHKIYAIVCLPCLTADRRHAAVDDFAEDGYTSPLFDIRPEDWGMGDKDWCKADWLDIANRAAAIVLDQITDSDLYIHKKKLGDDLKIIAPLVPVHGIADLHIGLIKINMDQGYMRAFDEVSAPDAKREKCEQLTEEITARRVAVWREEHKLIADWSDIKHRSPTHASRPWRVLRPWRILDCGCNGDVVDTKILYTIRGHKRELKSRIDERLAICGLDSLPYDYKRMYQKWEPHYWPIESPTKRPPIDSPWNRLDLGDQGSEVICEESQP